MAKLLSAVVVAVEKKPQFLFRKVVMTVSPEDLLVLHSSCRVFGKPKKITVGRVSLWPTQIDHLGITSRYDQFPHQLARDNTYQIWVLVTSDDSAASG